MYLGQTADSLAEYLNAYEDHWHELDDTAGELLEYADRTFVLDLEPIPEPCPSPLPRSSRATPAVGIFWN